MNRSPLYRAAPAAFVLGVLLGVLSLLYGDVFPDFRLYILGAGVGLVGFAVFGRPQDALKFLTTYWVVLAFIAAIVFVIAAPARWFDLPGLDALPEWVRWFVVLALLQAIALLIHLATRDRESFTAARTAVALNVFFLVEIGAALLVLVNVLGESYLGRLVGSYDATETKLYSLGDRTKSLLDSLADEPAPVQAVFIDYRPPAGNRGLEFLQQYAEYSPQIRIAEFTGLEQDAELRAHLSELGVVELDFDMSSDVLVFVHPQSAGAPNRKVVTLNEQALFTRSELGMQQFKGEELLTSAIQEVVLPPRKVYFLTGHRERGATGETGRGPLGFSTAVEQIEGLALTVETLNILEKGRIPDDADLLVAVAPQTALFDKEREALSRWLAGGGSLVLFVEPQLSIVEGSPAVTTGFEELLAPYGIEPRTTHITMTWEIGGTSAQAIITPTPLVPTNEYSFHPVVKDLRDAQLFSIFLRASPVIAKKPDGAEELVVEPLVYAPRSLPDYPQYATYASKLFPGWQLGSQSEEDLSGERIVVAAAAERKIEGGDDEGGKRSRVVVFGDADFASNVGLTGGRNRTAYAPGNATLLSNAVAWAVEREELVSIEPKTLETDWVTLTEQQRDLARTTSVWGLPIVVLACAIAAWWVRRR